MWLYWRLFLIVLSDLRALQDFEPLRAGPRLGPLDGESSFAPLCAAAWRR